MKKTNTNVDSSNKSVNNPQIATSSGPVKVQKLLEQVCELTASTGIKPPQLRVCLALKDFIMAIDGVEREQRTWIASFLEHVAASILLQRNYPFTYYRFVFRSVRSAYLRDMDMEDLIQMGHILEKYRRKSRERALLQ
ncbi:hypothetical protein ACOMHN_014254 [Nucella lapillus]